MALFRETFYALTGLFLSLAFLELLWTGAVLSRINLNWVLIVWGINGIILLRMRK